MTLYVYFGNRNSKIRISNRYSSLSISWYRLSTDEQFGFSSISPIVFHKNSGKALFLLCIYTPVRWQLASFFFSWDQRCSRRSSALFSRACCSLSRNWRSVSRASSIPASRRRSRANLFELVTVLMPKAAWNDGIKLINFKIVDLSNLKYRKSSYFHGFDYNIRSNLWYPNTLVFVSTLSFTTPFCRVFHVKLIVVMISFLFLSCVGYKIHWKFGFF